MQACASILQKACRVRQLLDKSTKKHRLQTNTISFAYLRIPNSTKKAQSKCPSEMQRPANTTSQSWRSLNDIVPARTNKHHKNLKAHATKPAQSPQMTSSPTSSNIVRLTPQPPRLSSAPPVSHPSRTPYPSCASNAPCHRLRIITNVAAIALIHVVSHHIASPRSTHMVRTSRCFGFRKHVSNPSVWRSNVTR
jgi:hypothetical protein